MIKYVVLFFSLLVAFFSSEALLRLSPYRALVNREPVVLDNGDTFYLYDKDLGYKIKPNSEGPVRAFPHDNISYRPSSNEYGCYDRPLIEDEFGLLVGDSFTFGTHDHLVKSKNAEKVNWAGHLEFLLNKRILKCGFDSYGTKQEYLFTEKILNELKHKPKFLLVQYYIGNDFFDDYLHPAVISVRGQKVFRHDLSKTNFETGELVLRTSEEINQKLDVAYKTQPSTLSRSLVTYGLIELFFSKKEIHKFSIPNKTSWSQSPAFFLHSDGKKSWLKKAWEEHLGNLRKFKELSNKLNIPLYIILVPTNDQVYPFLFPQELKLETDPTLPNKILSNFFEKEGIKYLDLLPELKKQADKTSKDFLNPDNDFYHKVDGHFSLKGEEVVGNITYNFLKEEMSKTP